MQPSSEGLMSKIGSPVPEKSFRLVKIFASKRAVGGKNLEGNRNIKNLTEHNK